MNLFIQLSLCSLVTVWFGLAAHGQGLPDSLRGRLDPERERVEPDTPSGSPAVPDGMTSVDASGLTGEPIRQVSFEGTAVPAIVADAAQPFIGAPLTKRSLTALVDALSDAYRASDIALFTLVVPEQTFEKGKVRVLVAEGHIEQVMLSGELTKGEQALVAAHVSRIQSSRPASRAALQRNLLLLDDIPGLSVRQKVLNGTGQSAVRLQLDAEQKRTEFSIGYDSRTTQLIDQGQLSGKATAFGVFRAGDETRLDVASSTNIDAFRYAGLQHSTPLGTNGTRATIGAAKLDSFADGTGISGEATLYSAGLSHPVIRSAQQNLNAALTLDALNSNNAALGSLIATERTRGLRGLLSYDHSNDNRSAGLSLKVSQGLDILEARSSDPVNELEFIKAEVGAQFAQRIARQYFLRLSARGQWTDDPLPANERFSVGGPNFGRAFENGLINADCGVSVLLETAWRPFKDGAFTRSEIYTFADYSTVEFIDRAVGSADLGSAGIGIRATYKKIGQFGIEASRPYNVPAPTYDEDWQVAVSWRIRYDPR